MVDPDDYSIKTVDANAMNKEKGRGGRGQKSGGKEGGQGRRSSSRGRAFSKPHQKPKSSLRKPPELALPSARMFCVGPALDANAEWPDHGAVGAQQRPDDPFAALDPHNPPYPSSRLGKAVIRRNNQLRKMFIGRMRANDGSYHDSSS
eukprot:2446170-Amphidinium_carterae.1